MMGLLKTNKKTSESKNTTLNENADEDDDDIQIQDIDNKLDNIALNDNKEDDKNKHDDITIENEEINNDEDEKNEKFICPWKHIFKTINYKGHNELIITNTQIKNAGKTWKGKKNQFEPRLLCKQDTENKRPEIFKEYKIFIVSIKNGIYLLTKTNIYCTPNYTNIPTVNIIKNNESVVLKFGNSETSLIDNLRYSGLFETPNFLNEPILFGSLLNGRHRCNFETTIGDKEIKISGSQFETDACYESENKILLIEGKSGNNKSFNIRQLYYPYRTIYDIDDNNKEMVTLYINKIGDITHIFKFVFDNPLIMTSIRQIAHYKYKFEN
jgi:hypothetical protein